MQSYKTINRIEELKNIQTYTNPRPFHNIKNKLPKWENQLRNDIPSLDPFLRDAILLYELVRTDIEYKDTGKKVLRPEQTYQQLEGDCADQTLLLASLYAVSEYISHIRIIIVRNTDNYIHGLLQIGRPPENIHLDEIHEAYNDLYGVETDGLLTQYQEKNGRELLWLTADPTSDRYLSCPDEFEAAGFVEDTGYSWQWINLLYYLDLPQTIS